MLRYLNSTPDPKLTQWANEVVEAVGQLLKIRGDGNIQVTMIGGVPTLSLRSTPDQTMIGYATADIDGATGDITSGLTPGVGEVQPCWWDEDDGVWKANAADTVTAHNLSIDSVTANLPIQLQRIKGQWVVAWEQCNAE